MVDCHIHMVLDGLNWKESIALHRDAPRMDVIRKALRVYPVSYTHLRAHET